ncbi:hypothetical protein P5673_018951, partial [Acropora cervicornis]
TPGFIALLFAKAVVATTVSANVKLATANQDAEARETDSERNNKEVQKRYDSFRNQEKETQLLGQQLEEKEKEYEECEAIKTLEKTLVEAKKLIASLKQELQSARKSSSVTEPQHPDPPQQQSAHVSSHSLSSIHSRYGKVLQTMKDNNCSMANAYRLSGCPRSTLSRDYKYIVLVQITFSSVCTFYVSRIVVT